MASAPILQFPQPVGLDGPYTFTTASRFSQNQRMGSPGPAGNLSSRSTSPSLRSIPRSHDTSFFPPPAKVPPSYGAVAAAKCSVDHAKLHKRAGSKSSRSGASQQPVDADVPSGSLTSSTPPPAVDLAKTESVRSPKKERLKQNLKKLSQQKDEDQNILDLSRTAEENEKISGLGIQNRPATSNSQTELNFGVISHVPGHTRNTSHASQNSVRSNSFKPSAPFTIPIRPSPTQETPPPTTTYSDTMDGTDYSTDSPSDPHPPEYFRPRGVSNPVVGGRPPLHVDTFSPPVEVTDPITLERPFTLPSVHQTPIMRPRGNTTQSLDTMATTKSSQSPIDKAFSFVSHRSGGKSESVDPLTRAASIQAARQAFQEREEAKAKKHQLQEQKAAERKRRKSDPRGTNPATGVPQNPLQMPGGEPRPRTVEGKEYRNLPVRTVRTTSSGKNSQDRPNLSKNKELRGKYFWFLSWLRTKFLNMGRKRKKRN